MNKARVAQIILSSLLLVLVLANILLVVGNQSVQSEVGERQQIIAHAIQVDTLSRQVVGAMADMALKTNDEALKKVLAASGVNLDGPASPPPASK